MFIEEHGALYDNDIIYSIFIVKEFTYYLMLFVDAFYVIMRASFGRVEKVLESVIRGENI